MEHSFCCGALDAVNSVRTIKLLKNLGKIHLILGGKVLCLCSEGFLKFSRISEDVYYATHSSSSES